jgi:inorganic pyrophosphatase/exopolyphosphatase
MLVIQFLFGDIQNLLVKLNTSIPEVSESCTDTNTKISSISLSEYKKKKRQDLREYFIEVIKASPNVGRKELQKLYNSSYQWLWTYDREWFDKVLPSPRRSGKKRLRKVDWSIRDQEIAQLIECKIDEIIKSKTQTARITRHYIARLIGCSSTLFHHLDKMPQAKALLTKYVESNVVMQQRSNRWNKSNHDQETAI